MFNKPVVESLELLAAVVGATKSTILHKTFVKTALASSVGTTMTTECTGILPVFNRSCTEPYVS